MATGPLGVTGYTQATGSESKQEAAETPPRRQGGSLSSQCCLVVELWKTLKLVSRNRRPFANDPSTSLGGMASVLQPERMWERLICGHFERKFIWAVSSALPSVVRDLQGSPVFR